MKQKNLSCSFKTALFWLDWEKAPSLHLQIYSNTKKIYLKLIAVVLLCWTVVEANAQMNSKCADLDIMSRSFRMDRNLKDTLQGKPRQVGVFSLVTLFPNKEAIINLGIS